MSKINRLNTAGLAGTKVVRGRITPEIITKVQGALHVGQKIKLYAMDYNLSPGNSYKALTTLTVASKHQHFLRCRRASGLYECFTWSEVVMNFKSKSL